MEVVLAWSYALLLLWLFYTGLNEAWLVIKRGLYLHPGGKPVIRSYGYVGNIVRDAEAL